MYVVGVFFTVLLVVCVLLLILDYIRVARLYGGSKLVAFKQIFFTVRKSQSWWILFVVPLSVAGTLYMLTDPLFRATVPVEIVVPGLLAVPISSLLIRLRPPAVFFLGSSQYGQQLFRSVRSKAKGYRVISFLQPSPNFASVLDHMMDGYRTGRSVDWTQIVRPLVETIPLLVLDTRDDDSSGVIEEARWLIQPHLRNRVLFVSTDTGTLPVLDAVDKSITRSDLHITTPQNCAQAIRDRLQAIEVAALTEAPQKRNKSMESVRRSWDIGSVLGILILCACGAGIGLLCGFIGCAVFVAKSPASFMAQTELSGTEALSLVVSACLGAIVSVWFGAGAHNGDFGFGAAPFKAPSSLLRAHGRSVSLGATYGAGAGAFAFTIVSLTMALMLMNEPKTAHSLWAKSSYWVVLSELVLGVAGGALVGGVVGWLLWRGNSRHTVRFNIPRNELVNVSWLRFAGVGTVYGATMFGFCVLAFWQFLGPMNDAGVIAASAGGLYFLCLALFIRRQYVVFLCEEFDAVGYARMQQGLDPAPDSDEQLVEEFFAAHVRTKKRVTRWATGGGMLCGAAIGLRLGIYASVVRLGSTGGKMWFMVIIGTLIGAILGSSIVILGPRLKISAAVQ